MSARSEITTERISDVTPSGITTGGVRLHLGDCRTILPTIESQSVDAIICDPPYPCIERSYGFLTEAEWWDLMMDVCREARRILKPTGSAVFILQPNSRKVGSMRGWLFRFQAWACDEWNMVQDAWWWAFNALPLTKNDPNRLRASLKACVWLGAPDCYRNAAPVRWAETDYNRVSRLAERCDNYKNSNSRVNVDHLRAHSAAARNGGVTPFNVLPIPNFDRYSSSGAHGARTPESLMDWWTRYLVPPGGTVCDPFCGSGTQGIVCAKRGLGFIGIESMPEYFAMAERRIDAEREKTPILV